MRVDPEYRVAPGSALVDEAVPEPVVEEPEFGPAPGTVAPADIINWPTSRKAKAAELRKMLEDLGAIHGVVDNGMDQTDLVLGSNKGGGKGGHFSPSRPAGPRPRRKRGESYFEHRERMIAWANAPRRPEIRINSRDSVVGEEEFFLLHELGHRMDCSAEQYVATSTPTSEFAQPISRTVRFMSDSGYRNLSPEAAEAFNDFLEAARETPNIKDAGRNFRPAFVRYHRDVKEVWARAYSQWAANQLGGTPREALTALQAASKCQWPDDEFEALMPHVENVLRKTGAMR